MKKVAILQSNYIPWKGYFDIINSVDTFIIYDEVQYTKNDWRNRNKIKTSQGTQWLTIPVSHKSLDQKIFETKVSLNNWNKKHWSSIKTNYGKAENFNTFKDQVENLYLGISTPFLTEINKIFIHEINNIFGINTEILDSRELNLKGDKNEKLIDAIKKVGGNYYISGSSAKSYLNEELFYHENIQVEWKNYSNYLEYNQIHPPFDHFVSILDLIFCSKKISKKFITS